MDHYLRDLTPDERLPTKDYESALLHMDILTKIEEARQNHPDLAEQLDEAERKIVAANEKNLPDSNGDYPYKQEYANIVVSALMHSGIPSDIVANEIKTPEIDQRLLDVKNTISDQIAHALHDLVDTKAPESKGGIFDKLTGPNWMTLVR